MMHYDLRSAASSVRLSSMDPTKNLTDADFHPRFEMGVNALMSETLSPPKTQSLPKPTLSLALGWHRCACEGNVGMASVF